MPTKYLTDWEHSIKNKIERNKECPSFPHAEDYGITDKEAEDYIYDKHRILDRAEERQKKFVVPGIILVMPVIILSGFGNSTTILFIGVALGIVFTMLYFVIMNALDKSQLKKLYDEKIERYINAVERFSE